MADYKVTKVSQEEPRVWDGDNGKVYYIKVMLEGHDKPVSIGKKTPDAIKVGDTVSGEITETQYETDKFKAEKKPYTPGFKGEPRDNDRIVAQWSIGQAVATLQPKLNSNDLSDVEEMAKLFYAMVDRVKGSSKPEPGIESARKVAADIKQKFSDGSSVPDEVYEVTDEPIDLKDIPF